MRIIATRETKDHRNGATNMARTSDPYFHLQADRGQPDNVSEAYSDFLFDCDEAGITDPAEIARLWDARCEREAASRFRAWDRYSAGDF